MDDDDLAFFMSPLAQRRAASIAARVVSTPSSMEPRRSSISLLSSSPTPTSPLFSKQANAPSSTALSGSQSSSLPPQSPSLAGGLVTSPSAGTIASRRQQTNKNISGSPTLSGSFRNAQDGAGFNGAAMAVQLPPVLRGPGGLALSDSHHSVEDGSISPVGSAERQPHLIIGGDEERHHQQAPPEAAYLMGATTATTTATPLLHPEYHYYAPPLRWRTNSNPREQRVPEGPGSPMGGPSGINAHMTTTSVTHVGSHPVLWTDDTQGRRDRSEAWYERQRNCTTLSPLDATIARLAEPQHFVEAAATPNGGDSSPDAGAGAAHQLAASSSSPTPSMFSRRSLQMASPSHDGGTLTSTTVNALPTSVRLFYSQSHITPFRRVHVHDEDEHAPHPPSLTDATVDSRRVWGPKEERKYEGVYRAWWQ